MKRRTHYHIYHEVSAKIQIENWTSPSLVMVILTTCLFLNKLHMSSQVHSLLSVVEFFFQNKE